jgi:tetratricopeptide (TPR) repeat protein
MPSMKCRSKIPLFAAFALAAVFFYNPAIGLGNTALQEAEEESSPEYIEQYDAWEAATKEPDIQKSGSMLIEFLEKYPDSTLLQYAESSYVNLMVKCTNEKNFQDLEILAEKWLKRHPGDLPTMASIATAAKELGHNEKYIQSLIGIYEKQPTGNLAIQIAKAYKSSDNKAKYIEWMEAALKYPEFETDFRTRLDLVVIYLEDEKPAKAIEFARAALKAADLVKDPGSETKEQLRVVRRSCHDTIGKIMLQQEKYEEAISSFKQALRLEESSESCYYIAYCLRMQKNIDDAMLWYARAEQHGGEYANKAKENLETLYKALHNNTLIGIDKIYRKAKQQPGTAEVRN